jgi:drug/metabolite transporter (DMT)-like permease
MKKERLGSLQIIISQFLIGFVYILVRLGENFGIYNLAFFRVFLSAGFILLFAFLYKKYEIVAFKHEKGKMFLFGFLHGVTILLSFLSIHLLSISSAVLLSSTISIWTIVFSYFILKEEINKKTIFALAVSFIGIILIVSPNRFFINESLIGSLAGIFVGVLGGFLYTLSKTFKHYDKVSLTFYQNLVAIPFLIPLLFVQPINFNLSNVLIALSMGFVAAFSFILIFKGIGLVKGQKVGILSLLNVVFTVLLAFLFFGEIPLTREIIGGILIILSFYLAIRSQ